MKKNTSSKPKNFFNKCQFFFLILMLPSGKFNIANPICALSLSMEVDPLWAIIAQVDEHCYWTQPII